MSIALTLSVISALLALFLVIEFAFTGARWRIRLAIMFAIVGLLTALFDIGVIKAYEQPERPFRYGTSQNLR